VTGEVLNQRPMSQTYRQLRKVNNSTDFKEYIVRPLSARNLPTTIPEKEGWVDRNKFYNINGRSRKIQMSLADKYGITEYENPGGGCLLTESGSSNKIREIKNTTLSFDVKDASIVNKGRYFRIQRTLLIVGCNKQENDFLREVNSEKYSVIEPPVIKGPTSLVYNVTEFTEETVARIILKYCKLTEENNVLVINGKEVEAKPFTENEHLKYIIQ
jgi:tRNA-specific 2-thiouridylase